ncbi:MAG: hypothetical protein V2A54_04555 [Bacteroidota bacterium]
MKFSFIITFLLLCSLHAFSQKLKTYTATPGDSSSYENIWIELNGGCSLGCAIGWTLDVTSSLPKHDTITYIPNNMNDGNRNTAWVEGAKEYGIGEKIIIRFDTAYPCPGVSFRSITLTNGYAKSEEVWADNSRVKMMKLIKNGKPLFYIKLLDTIIPQYIRWNYKLMVATGDVIELEIVSVYKGRKWKDTAISDLSLMGAH